MVAFVKLVASTFRLVTATATTALVSSIADGVRLATILVMNSSMRSSPSFFKNVLVMLITTASIGMSASKLP